MTGNAAAPTTTALEPAHAATIVATLPLVGANIEAITTEFYRRLFAHHPELQRNLFNRGNQAQGAQQRALAASIATFATHLVNPDLPHPAELLSRIGHKHASLGIVPEQYPVVHEHLFAAIVEVLGADVVTAEVAAAWDRVYWLMAQTLIDLEHRLYTEAGVADGDVYRRARVLSRVDDPSGAVLVTVRPDAEGDGKFRPGQYVSVGLTMPDGARQLRQYSLINVGGSGELSFAVRPAGEVSDWIGNNLLVGDLVDVTVPFGDLPTPQVLGERSDGRKAGTHLVLISAGIGVTPMIGILEALAAQAPDTKVQILHADRSDQTHPLRQRQRELLAKLPGATLDIWYEDGQTAGMANVHPGLLRLDNIDLPAEAEVYLCGADGFVRAVRDQLTAAGVQRVHCELFSPNDWLL